MKQQKTNEPYEALRGAFSMQPERKQALEQEIRKRAALRHTEQQTAAETESDFRTEKNPKRFGGYWLAVRLIPLTACFVLAVAGVMFLRHEWKLTAETDLSSMSDLEEQLTLPVTTAATTVSEPQTDTGTSARTTVSRAASTVTTQTDAQTTSSAPETTTVTETETTAAETETTPEITKTTALTTTTVSEVTTVTTSAAAFTTATTETETETQPVQTEPETQTESAAEQDDAKLQITVGNYTAEAGETLNITVKTSQAFECAGLQYALHLKTNDGAEQPVFSAYESDLTEILAEAGESLVTNIFGQECIFTFGSANEFSIPKDAVLISLTLTIPEDAPAGTVYKIAAEKTECKIVNQNLDELEDIVYADGSITVA